VLSEREKLARLEKLNMVIESFFSEVGWDILTYFSNFDPKLSNIKKDLMMTSEWSDKDFYNVYQILKNFDFAVNSHELDLENLRIFLREKRTFLLLLLQNPNLLEHESFTELLMAVFHLTEELIKRKDLTSLPATDYDHLSGDIKRVYGLLINQWLDYMKYLLREYPYLFSLAMRTNPFDEEASPIVR
jgi:hypothetical protein